MARRIKKTFRLTNLFCSEIIGMKVVFIEQVWRTDAREPGGNAGTEDVSSETVESL